MLSGRDLLFIKGADLRHLNEKHCAADLGDSWNGAPDSAALGQIRIVLDQRVDSRISGLRQTQGDSPQSQGLVVGFMLTFLNPKKPPRTTSRIFGGPIHAAAGNRQRRSDH